MAKRKKKHIIKPDLTLPEIPNDMTQHKMLNYISNVNCIYDFISVRDMRVIKCLEINKDIIDQEHSSLITQLYRYVNYHHDISKNVYVISEIKRIFNILLKYSKTLIIFKITDPCFNNDKILWCSEILKFLIPDMWCIYHTDSGIILLYLIESAITNMLYANSYDYFTYIFDFILKVIKSSETEDDIRYITTISSEATKKNTKIDALVNIQERDEIIKKLYNDILTNEYTDFHNIIKIIDKLKYVPNKVFLKEFVFRITHTQESNMYEIANVINSMMFKF